MPITISAKAETWPLKEAFKISRGAKTEAHVIVATVSDGAIAGRGEAVPYARYRETVETALSAIASVATRVTTREALQQLLPPGAARNALDCAFWDYEARTTGRPAAEIAGTAMAEDTVTAFTISLDAPETMAAKAAAAANLPLLKLKLGGQGDAERMHAVRRARPDARLIVDANEAWTPELWPELIAAARACAIEAIEQPLPAEADAALAHLERPLPICADESVHTRADLPRLRGLYDAVNIKLDKAGGLTEALALKNEARAHGFKIMIGSMVATSLAVAPALLLAGDADWVDLDGPLLLAKDRTPGLNIVDGRIVQQTESAPSIWG